MVVAVGKNLQHEQLPITFRESAAHNKATKPTGSTLRADRTVLLYHRSYMKPTVGGVKHASIDFLFGDLDSRRGRRQGGDSVI
jgi:hypothetical protein